MEETTQQVASEVLEWMRGTESFVATQAPLLAQDIVRWGIGAGIGLVFLATLAAVAGFVFYRALLPGAKDEGEATPMTCVIGLVTTFASLGFGFNGGAMLLKATFAPRLYVIEKLASMIGGG